MRLLGFEGGENGPPQGPSGCYLVALFMIWCLPYCFGVWFSRAVGNLVFVLIIWNLFLSSACVLVLGLTLRLLGWLQLCFFF